MTKSGPVLLGCVLATVMLGTARAASGEEAQANYLLEARVLKVPSSPPWSLIRAESGRIEMISAPQSALQLGASAQIAFGQLLMSVDGDAITWNGEPEPPEGSGIEILAAPQLAILDGQKAKLMISSGPLEYFEAEEDGRFVLRHIPEAEQPGITLEATVAGDAATDRVRLDSRLRIARCVQRQRLPGVGLDVGRPVISQQELQTSILLDPGAWCLLGGHRSQSATVGDGEHTSDGHGLLVLVRVGPISADQ